MRKIHQKPIAFDGFDVLFDDFLAVIFCDFCGLYN